jgi:hypothetical protein
MYAIIRDGRVYNTGTLESMFISNVFPGCDTPEWRIEHCAYIVKEVPYDPDTEVLASCDPIIDGEYVTLHKAVPKPVIEPPVAIPVDPVQTIDLSSAADSVADSVADSI